MLRFNITQLIIDFFRTLIFLKIGLKDSASILQVEILESSTFNKRTNNLIMNINGFRKANGLTSKPFASCPQV